MREIRFRAWDVDAQRMIDDPFYFEPIRHEPPEDLHNTPMYSIAEDWQEWEDGIRCEGFIMQYTGLRDKHGKEIYEGDIVKVISGGFDHWRSEKFTVYYCDDTAKFMITNNKSYPHDIKDQLGYKYLEVIGNIYQQ